MLDGMAVSPVLTGSVTTPDPKVGQPLEVRLSENLPKPGLKLEYGVADSQGNSYGRSALDDDGATYFTTPSKPGPLTITANLLRVYDQAAAPPLVLTTSVASLVKLLPGQVAGKVIVGMSTDDYAARTAETGPVGSDHFFVSSWNPGAFLAGVKKAQSRGLYAFGNMKTGSWSAAAGGSLDASATQLAEDLEALGWPCHICFHHEPGFKAPDGQGEAGSAVDWVNMHNRLAPRMMAAAPTSLVAGCVINGFIMDPNTKGQGWTDAELNQLFTDKFLETIGSFGGDYYDGGTTRTNGHPCVNKVARADAWMESRGAPTRMSIGEFSFLAPGDASSLFAVCKAKPERWWVINAFNSDNNNRPLIPTQGGTGGWNFTHWWDTKGDRLNAFKGMLADSLSSP